MLTTMFFIRGDLTGIQTQQIDVLSSIWMVYTCGPWGISFHFMLDGCGLVHGSQILGQVKPILLKLKWRSIMSSSLHLMKRMNAPLSPTLTLAGHLELTLDLERMHCVVIHHRLLLRVLLHPMLQLPQIPLFQLITSTMGVAACHQDFALNIMAVFAKIGRQTAVGEVYAKATATVPSAPALA